MRGTEGRSRPTHLILVFEESRHGHPVYIRTARCPQPVLIFIQNGPPVYRMPREPHVFKIILVRSGRTELFYQPRGSLRFFGFFH